MKRILVLVASISCVNVASICAALIASPSALAETELKCTDYIPSNYDSHTPADKPVIRNKIYDKLSEAQEKINEGSYEKAEKALREILEISSKKSLFYGIMDFEIAMANFILGNVYFLRGDVDQSISYYKKAIAQQKTPLNFPNSMKDSLSAVYEKSGDIGCAIAVLESITWNGAAGQAAKTHLKLAKLYNSQEKNATSLEYVSKAESYYADQKLPYPEDLIALKDSILGASLDL
jgi:tetratricopeptide (TPR) repeat protein